MEAPARDLRNTRLTPRELDVLCLLTQGLTSQQIAERLMIGLVTVKFHVHSIYRKMGVSSRAAATRCALTSPLMYSAGRGQQRRYRMPGRFGPKQDIVIGEEAAQQLQFLVLIERAMQGDPNIPENDIVERLIAARYAKAQEHFKKAMAHVEQEA